MQAALSYIRSQTSREPRVAVVLGSGLGAFAEELSHPLEIPYARIPDWPVSTAMGHAGKLVFGKIDGLEIAVMAGRTHLYEGYSPAEVTIGVRVLHRLGARSIIFTNAAGGIILLATSETRTLSLLALNFVADGQRESATVITVVITAITTGMAILVRTLGLNVGIRSTR